MQIHLLVIHGPNLNLLGSREPEHYGTLTLKEINSRIKKHCAQSAITVRIFQSNCEGALIDFIHRNRGWAQGIVINPAAYTHYSIALRDALLAVDLPAVEVHLSDTKKREPFRRRSVIKDACIAVVRGLQWKSYIEGIRVLQRRLGRSR